MCPGVHPALQPAYPASGTSTYPALWNSGQQSQKTCYRSSPRDLQAPRARRGASAAERYGQIDVLSVVRKSRNSSGGFYRCRRRSAHDRSRTNAMRFLMNTLLALISIAVDSCVLAKLSLDALGTAAVFVSSAKPGSRHPRLPARHNYSARSFGTSSILLLEAAARAIYASEIPPCRRLHPSAHGTFPIRLSNVRGRLRPTVD